MMLLTGDITESFSDMTFVFASILFILSLAGLSNQESAKQGNLCGMCGMLCAIVITLFAPGFHHEYVHLIIAFIPASIVGGWIAYSVPMTAMPETVAAFHSFVGLGAVLVGISNYLSESVPEGTSVTLHLIEIFIGVYIGGLTFTGSVVAFLKLHALISGKPLIIFGWGRHLINLGNILITIVLCVLFCGHGTSGGLLELFIMTALSFLLGFMLVMSIGGADMPVVVSMLNSYSGWACAASGFMLENPLLIITGALVGSSGAILSYIMCAAMNRSFISVIAGGFGGEGVTIAPPSGVTLVHTEISLPDVVAHLKTAKSVIIVPGYGMAVARCQDQVAEIAATLRKAGKKVSFCIHPVAGRLPGHMNVLLAEADVPYDIVLEMKDVNRDFPTTDMALVVGANDIVNPAAIDDPNSLIAGMPVCEVWKAKECIVFKRSLRTGYAGIENMLFYKDTTKMCFGDAKDTMLGILNELSSSGLYEAPKGLKKGGYMPVPEEKKEEKKEEVLKPLPPPRLSIGVIKETTAGEKRVMVIPSLVRSFMEYGFKVMIERDAGVNSGYLNEEYEKAGASIVSRKEAWRCDVVMKCITPTENEIGMLNAGAVFISTIYPNFNANIMKALSKAKVSVFALDQLPRITRAQKMDFLSSQGNLAGYRAVVEAASLMPRYFSPQMTAAGSFKAARVLIVGCGVAGLAALGAARKLGAIVSAFDSRPATREQVESLGGKFLEVTVEEDGSGSGGYGKVMSPAFIAAEMELFAEQAKECDVIITTALIPGKPSPLLIKASTVRLMKRGSVVIDLGIREGGGNCELTRLGELYVDEKSGVTICGYTIGEFTSRMAQQASMLLSHNMLNLVNEFGGLAFKLDRNDEICYSAVIIENGDIKWPVKPRQASQPVSQPKKPSGGISVQSEQKIESTDAGLKDLLLADVPPSSSTSFSFKELWKSFGWVIHLLILAGLFIGVAFGTPHDFHILFFEFILAVIIGYHVVWSVTPALHTPLMSETNAISGIIVLGSMLELFGPMGNSSVILGIFGVFFASINIVGGFWVTLRMLTMFHR